MTELRFDGKVALVTGAGRGIGRAHALQLASRGCRVMVNDPGPDIQGAPANQDPASEVVREIEALGGTAIANRNSVVGGASEMVQAALDAFGRLDIVVNNAGIVRAGMFGDLPAADWWEAFDVHFRGSIDVTRAAWPHLAASGAGRVVNTASTAMLGAPAMTNYGAAKAGIFGFTRTAALEGAAVGINVNAILPGAWTRMTQSMPTAAMRNVVEQFHHPDHVAAFVAWLAHENTKVTGEAFTIGGGLAARVVLAAEPAVRIGDSTPEAWAEAADTLLAGRPLERLGSLYDAFEAELRVLDPKGADRIIEAIHESKRR